MYASPAVALYGDSVPYRPPNGDPPLTGQQALTCFLLGLGSNLCVRVIGYLPISELAIVICTPFLLPKLTSRRVMRYAKVPVLLGGLWLGTQILTDVILQTRFDLVARGIARSFILLICVPFFVWFLEYQTPKRLLWIAAGMIPSVILSAYILRPGSTEGRELVTGALEFTWQNHWVAVAGMTNRFVALVFYSRRRLLAYGASGGLGVLNVAMGSRSAGALPLVGVAACSAYNTITGQKKGRRLGFGKFVLLATVVLAAVGGVLTVYKQAARSGSLGREAQQKYEKQSENRLGLIGGGRGDVIIGLLAVWESPFVGYGSWPLDKYGFYLKGCEFLGEEPNPDYYRKGFPVIPAHSHIVGTWNEGGILAIGFWVYALIVTSRVFYRPLRHDGQLRLWATLSAISMIWNILFSPIGFRMPIAIVLATFIRELKDGVAVSPALLPAAAGWAPNSLPSRAGS